MLKSCLVGNEIELQMMEARTSFGPRPLARAVLAKDSTKFAKCCDANTKPSARSSPRACYQSRSRRRFRILPRSRSQPLLRIGKAIPTW